MTNLYEYVVLRLAPDTMRGEVLNVGLVLFKPDAKPEVLIHAALPKLRALDADWNHGRLNQWRSHVASVLKADRSVEEHVQILSSLGYCVAGEPGMFTAKSDAEVRRELAEVRALYIQPKGHVQLQRSERKTRLTSELRKRFESMNRLGKSIDDLSNHLIVQNVPVPSHPDLKADFVYKNGVYRITQTLDYRVSVIGAHQKVNEACMKSMAADFAAKEWGEDTVRLAVVHIPEEVAEIADSHLDLMLAKNFKIFHANDEQQLFEYQKLAFGESDGAFALQS